MENDLFNELVQINASLNSGLLNLSQGINAVLIQQQFTNAALVEKIAQEKTMICELEQIASRTSSFFQKLICKQRYSGARRVTYYICWGRAYRLPWSRGGTCALGGTSETDREVLSVGYRIGIMQTRAVSVTAGL